jgi:pyruvate dehydrogenase E1 component alpha subunit/2-oxoisovalerate dehydrogenase E1 component alpha subunit
VTTPDARIEHFRWMVLGRVLDERLAALYRQGHIRGGSVFSGKGQEAYSAAGALALRRWRDDQPGDFLAPLIRDTAGRLAFGESVLDAVRNHLGRSTGPMRGRDGNIHRGNLRLGQFPMISHLGSSVSVVSGALLARRLLGTLGDSVGMVNIGDGGMQTGALHEGLNVAAVERLPLVLLVADNQVSYSTFSDRTYACRSLVDRAVGYGIAGHTCDGTDFDACRATVSQAVAAARSGQGPQMVVATLLRLAGHGEHDDGSYVGAELRARFGDCVLLADAALARTGVDTAAIWEAARNEVAAAVTQAQSEPEPDPRREDWSARSLSDLTEFRP